MIVAVWPHQMRGEFVVQNLTAAQSASQVDLLRWDGQKGGHHKFTSRLEAIATTNY